MLKPLALHALGSGGHPVWMCGMRPFFLATAAGAVLMMLAWLFFLSQGLPIPSAAGGPVAWHAHELLFGVSLASVVGFLLTAVPEFTRSPDFEPCAARRLAALWLLGRLAYGASGAGGMPLLLISLLLHLSLILTLAAMIAPRLWRDPARAHLSFLWVLSGLAVCEAGFHVALMVEPADATRWLQAAVEVYMILIVVALSRISMRIVNAALDEAGSATAYFARPPRRQLAVICIALHTAAELAWPGSRVTGWLALAAGAAVFHLLNDWHVGRPLLRRWPLMLYAVYACMGSGYVLIGLAPLSNIGSASGGRHLLAVGALGLALLAAMVIAGRAHSGEPADERPWVPAAATMLLLAALVRSSAGWLLTDVVQAWMTAGALWCLAFVAYAAYLAPVLLTPRSDGRNGCHAVESE